ncbi:uncharacterized protein EAF02_005522 [Botrytis sinoallii]|uniref:uncharacterized protein n=1 Tax=Botrytis sinoallii TaxID=1463999 RepID=UPI0019026301|nr:uncharacterized protein EAF02_005522 [Botrytis sinoallii]KAF7883602.1 hypothetical protein EAF02_005522 [Botrytis sinoallii]
MDNSGQDPLKIPGHVRDFTKDQMIGKKGGVQKPRLTARELAMIGLTNFLTDMPNWYIGVFNDRETAMWHKMVVKNKLISEKAWGWCLAELRDKARLFRATNRVLALDAGACVFISDVAVPKTLTKELSTASLRASWKYRIA